MEVLRIYKNITEFLKFLPPTSRKHKYACDDEIINEHKIHYIVYNGLSSSIIIILFNKIII